MNFSNIGFGFYLETILELQFQKGVAHIFIKNLGFGVPQSAEVAFGLLTQLPQV